MKRIFQIKYEEHRPHKFPCAIVEVRKNYYLFGVKLFYKKGGSYVIKKSKKQ